MKEIVLSNGSKTQVDDDDFVYINQWRWFYTKGHAARKPGRSTTTVYMHREILKPPKRFEVDHIDGNRLNNQKDNLRICTNQQNQMNRSKHKEKTSKYKGVWFNKRTKRWIAAIHPNGKRIILGRYLSENEAAVKYNDAARKYFREFARINNITPDISFLGEGI